MDPSEKDLDRLAEFSALYDSSIHHPTLGMISPTEFYKDGEALVFRHEDRDSCQAIVLGLWLVPWGAGCYFAASGLAATFTVKMLLVTIVMFGSWLGVAGLALWRLYVYEILRIGPDGIVYLVQRSIKQTRKEIALDRVTKIDLNREPDSSITIHMVNDAKPIKLCFGRNSTMRRWAVEVLQRRLDELKQGHGKPGRADLVDHKTLAISAKASNASRRIFVPGEGSVEKPADPSVKIDDRPGALKLTLPCEYSWVGFSLGCVIVLCFIALIPTISILTQPPLRLSQWVWLAFVTSIPCVIFGVYFIRLARQGVRGEVLRISREQLWLEHTSLKEKPKPIPLARIKTIGIDDPALGVGCADEFTAVNTDHVILVFLDHRLVKLLGFPVHTQEEADWIAELILRRFPQMFDPSVLPK